jgi:hypothetical protein
MVRLSSLNRGKFSKHTVPSYISYGLAVRPDFRITVTREEWASAQKNQRGPPLTNHKKLSDGKKCTRCSKFLPICLFDIHPVKRVGALGKPFLACRRCCFLKKQQTTKTEKN